MNKDLMLLKGPAPSDDGLWPEDFEPAPMGEVSSLKTQISTALPDVEWFGETEGSLETGETRILFSFPEEMPLRTIDVEVGSGGDPENILQALCEKTGWCLFDLAEAEFIEFG